MRTFYPAIEPYASGMLDVGDGQRLYWEESGRPDGKPVVFLHGGPGGGTSPVHRRLFDPAVYRIVLVDQRGCGRSTPHASEPGATLETNTTWHLVADLERLREARGIERWQVLGGSWGSALALAYAETHPERVTELILRGVFLLRPSELEWFYEAGGRAAAGGPQADVAGERGDAASVDHGLGGAVAALLPDRGLGGAAAVLPDRWEAFAAPVPEAERGSMIAAYHRLLHDPDPAVHGPAAVAWSSWEAASLTLLPDEQLIARFSEPAYALAFARIENHYFVHGGWFEPSQLLRDAHRLRDIPGVIVHGRYDLCTPATNAWELHRAWPEAELHLIPDAGHAFDQPGILDALITATDRFGERA